MRIKNILFAAMAIVSLYCVSAFAQTYAVVNAKIVTGTGSTIEKGTVVVRKGLIESVGASVNAPADAVVIDGTGLTIYPGLIDSLTNLGTAISVRPQGGGAAAGASTETQTNSNYPLGLQPEDAVETELKAGDAQFENNRNAGFTTALTVGRSGVFNGRSAVINLAGDSVSAMILKAPFAEHITYTQVGRGEYPGSLLGTFSALRQMFLDAKRLQEMQKAYAANPRGNNRPASDRSLEALFPIINREIPVVINANSEREIIRSLDFAKEFNLKLIIGGGDEAWKVAERLKNQGVAVLLSLNFPKRTTDASPEADDESLEVLRSRADAPKSAARLTQAGVKFAFQSGGMTNLGDYLGNAKKVMDSGLGRDATIRAMTLNAAEIFGLDNVIGSIETGKIANLFVVRGDIFDKGKAFTHTFVDGKLFEIKAPAKPTSVRGGQGSANAVAISGSYNVTIEAPGQQLTGTIEFNQQGQILTGKLQTQLGTTVIKDGKVSGDSFSFAGTVEYAGSVVEIQVKGTVNGSQISGTIDSAQGAIPFTGSKIP